MTNPQKIKAYHNHADCRDPYACKYRVHVLGPITKTSKESDTKGPPGILAQLKNIEDQQEKSCSGGFINFGHS